MTGIASYYRCQKNIWNGPYTKGSTIAELFVGDRKTIRPRAPIEHPELDVGKDIP